MIGTERFLIDGQRSLEERLGIHIATLFFMQQPKVAQPSRDGGMIGTEGFLPNR
jgi:hypothetical protein